MTFSGGCVTDRGGDCGTFVMMVSVVVSDGRECGVVMVVVVVLEVVHLYCWLIVVLL